MKNAKVVLFWIVQVTWGIFQNVLGLVTFAANIKGEHGIFHGSIVTVWNKKASMSIGMFIFMTEDPFFYYHDYESKYTKEEFSRMILVHEYGHTVQSAVLGPAYLLVIGLPSMIWSYHPYFKRVRERGVSYYDAYQESWANRWGERVTQEDSIGRALY